MLALIAYYSTVDNSYYTRLKFGVELADYVYVGPEALALGDDYFSQGRVGAHFTGLKFGAAADRRFQRLSARSRARQRRLWNSRHAYRFLNSSAAAFQAESVSTIFFKGVAMSTCVFSPFCCSAPSPSRSRHSR